MIVWISGAYGVGKSTFAEALWRIKSITLLFLTPKRSEMQ